MPKRSRENEIPMTVPVRAVPLVRLLYAVMLKRLITYSEVAEESGMCQYVLRSGWRCDREPLISNLNAALNVVGYQLAAVPLSTQLDEFGRVTRLSHEPLSMVRPDRRGRKNSRALAMQELPDGDTQLLRGVSYAPSKS